MQYYVDKYYYSMSLQGKTESQASQGDQKQLFFFSLQSNILAAPVAP